MPMRPSSVVGDPEALAKGAAQKATNGECDVAVGQAATSILTFTFNILWSGFLGKRKPDGITHFAMIHDDIRPQAGWLDVLLAEMDEHDADMVSAVVPIKDGRGLTSTGIDDTGDGWNPRRLALREAFGRPATFTDPAILLNTGLFVCRFDRPWCEEVQFRQQDRIVNLDGDWVAQTKPEDWDFSRQLRGHGARLFATRKVILEHERPEWHTRHAWGAWDTDRDAGTLPKLLSKTLAPAA